MLWTVDKKKNFPSDIRLCAFLCQHSHWQQTSEKRARNKMRIKELFGTKDIQWFIPDIFVANFWIHTMVRHKKGSVKIYSLLFEHIVMGHTKKIFFFGHISHAMLQGCNQNFLRGWGGINPHSYKLRNFSEELGILTPKGILWGGGLLDAPLLCCVSCM